VDLNHALLSAVFLPEQRVQLAGSPHLHGFRGHDRPSEHREDDEDPNDNFTLERGSMIIIEQAALGEKG
jgi:hypothetical protein